MDITNHNEIKAQIFTCINKNKNSYDEIISACYQDESFVNAELKILTSINVLKFDVKTKKYNFAIEPKGEKVILDGNILLPVTIIRKETETLVMRGFWYSFPPDFDVNRIIWNVALEEKTKSSLVDLLELTQQKIRKSKIKQLPEYEKLKNIIIPYNKDFKFKIDIVGEELTSIIIIFTHQLFFDGKSGEGIEWRGFQIKSEISTNELITELRLKSSERDFTKIKINKIFNFSDLIFSKNEIPYNYDGTKIEFVNLDRIRGEFRLIHFVSNNAGVTREIDVEKFSYVNDGLIKLKEIFEIYAKSYLNDIDFQIT